MTNLEKELKDKLDTLHAMMSWAGACKQWDQFYDLVKQYEEEFDRWYRKEAEK